MWSLGAILLELLTGIPIWMSLKCRTVPCKGKS
jgi:dual specificity tyrosine-phosphorylation-regulated kinase 2/3/4